MNGNIYRKIFNQIQELDNWHYWQHLTIYYSKFTVHARKYLTMSIPFSGSKNLGIGVVSAISKHLKSVNLRGVQRITVKFDPFHEQVASTR